LPTPPSSRTREAILVTGGAGFIGSHLVERLLALGYRVVALDNFDPFYSPDEKRRNLTAALTNPAFRLVEADCADPRQLEEGLAGEPIDAIVHLAAKAGVRPSLNDPIGYARANVMATQTLLEFARQRGIQRFVFGSSSSVYGNRDAIPFSEDDPADRPVSPYAATKRAGEIICHTYAHLYGMRIIALRFFTVYGPRQRPDLAIRKFATLMLDGSPFRCSAMDRPSETTPGSRTSSMASSPRSNGRAGWTRSSRSSTWARAAPPPSAAWSTSSLTPSA